MNTKPLLDAEDVLYAAILEAKTKLRHHKGWCRSLEAELRQLRKTRSTVAKLVSKYNR